MALNAYINGKCSKQGPIKGGCIQKGREGSVEIISASHAMESPRDPASGAATGKRSHKPVRLTAVYDQSIIQWNQALFNNEVLTEVVIGFWSPNKLGQDLKTHTGTETLTYEIKLTNSFVARCEFQMLNNRNPDLVRYENTFTIELVYQKIEFNWKIGNKLCSDDWMTPIV
jgi:type VI secretion system secreted protein Hcp